MNFNGVVQQFLVRLSRFTTLPTRSAISHHTFASQRIEAIKNINNYDQTAKIKFTTQFIIISSIISNLLL